MLLERELEVFPDASLLVKKATEQFREKRGRSVEQCRTAEDPIFPSGRGAFILGFTHQIRSRTVSFQLPEVPLEPSFVVEAVSDK